MAIAAAQLASSSVAPQFATPPSSAPVSRVSSSGTSFALRRLRSIGGSSRIGGRISKRDGLARVKLLPIKAAAPEEAGEEFKRQAKEVFDDLKSKWDGVGNKSSVALIGSGAFLALWFSSTVVNTINNVPLLPNLMELIGLAYSAWFFYRYLLFQDNRKELAAELKELKHKITGTTDDISKQTLSGLQESIEFSFVRKTKFKIVLENAVHQVSVAYTKSVHQHQDQFPTYTMESLPGGGIRVHFNSMQQLGSTGDEEVMVLPLNYNAFKSSLKLGS